MRPLHHLLTLFVMLLLLPEPLSAQVKKNEPVDTVVQSVKEYSEKDGFFSKLVKGVLVNDDIKEPANALSGRDVKLIKKFTGKIIRNIQVDVLDVFGASVDDPYDSIRTWFQDRGNSLHMKTHEWLIKNKLLFSEGFILLPYDIHESERIIRQSPYVYDVRIIPQKISDNSDSVDIMVYVQDIWSMNGGVSYNPGSKSGNVAFNDLNFLGFGNEFKGGPKFNKELNHGWDWDGSYTVDNIKRTFISANVYYLSQRDRQQYGFRIGRDFFSPVIEWGGGLGQQWQNTKYPYLIDHNGLAETARYNQQDYWLGYAFDLKPFDTADGYQNRFNVAGRITRTVFSQKPEFDTMNVFQNTTFYLGRIGYSVRTYYTDNYIFGLGKTEDIPLITMVELLFGVEQGANSSRPYLGIKTGYSFYEEHLGYFYGGVQNGAFKSNGKWLSRTSIIETLFFSDLLGTGRYRWRHYIGSRYSYTYDPLRPQDILNINNDGGLRGFSDGELLGNKKLVLNYEADIFVPLKFLGFKLAIITFADFGLIASTNNSLFASRLYQGYGIGFRIKNENLIFPPIQIMFGFYPATPPSGGEHFAMFHQGALYYHLNQFQFSTPSIVSTE